MKRHLLLVTLVASFFLVFLPGSASGAVLCKSNQTPCAAFNIYPVGTPIKFSLVPETKLQKEWSFSETCKEATGEGNIETAGGASTPVAIALSKLTFQCGCPTTVVKPGKLSIESVEGVMSGVLRWSGLEFKASCGLGIECLVSGEVPKGIGLKGGGKASFGFVLLPMPAKSFCSGQVWTARFNVTAPTPLYVSGSTSESLSGEGVLCLMKTTPCPESFFSLPAHYQVGDSISATLKPGTFSVIEAGFANIKCEEATMNGEVVNAGGTGEPVVAALSSLSFGNCNCKVTVLKKGRLSVRWTSGVDGSLWLEGFEIAVDCGGKVCTLGGTAKEGISAEGAVSEAPASIKMKEAAVPKKSGIVECSPSSKWSAEYEVTSGGFVVTQN